MSIICTCGKASGFACNGAAGCPLNATDGMPAPKTKPMSNNPNTPLLPDDRRFKRGDKVSCGTTTVLVSGDGDEDSFFAGVVIEQTNNEFPYHFPVGQYSRSWIAINFEKSEPKSQPGPVWVKASERLPTYPDDPNNHYRLNKKKVIGNFYKDADGMMFFEVRSLAHEPYQIGWKSFQYLEWLDESPAEQPGREVEAVTFAEWLYKNRWFHFENGKWYYTFEMGTVMGDKSYQKNYVKSTAQLWEVFKKEGNYPQ